MSGTLQTPVSGQPNAVEDPKIATAVSTLNGLLTASNKLDGAQLGANTVVDASISNSANINGVKLNTGTVTDAKLTSPNNSAYRTLLTGGVIVVGGMSAATVPLVGEKFFFSSGSYVGSSPLGGTDTLIDGNAAAGSVNNTPYSGSLIYFDDADCTVAGLTQKLRLRAQVNNNGTAWSSVTATFGLYPVTFSGGTKTLTMTLGTVVSGSTVALANPAANTTTQGNSGDFTVPSDGQYVLACVTGAALTTNSASLLTAQLQTRNV